MKNKQYYSVLPKKLYKTNNLDLIIEHLIENNICNKFTSHQYSGNFEKTAVLGEYYSKSKVSKIYDSIIYNKEIIKEFYNFLLTHYKAGLGQHIPFNLKIYQDTFGLNYTESKKIALEYFDIYYNEIPINPSFKLKFDKYRNIIPATKFESLSRYKDCLYLNLEDKTDLIIPYLAGDNDYYNRDKFENNSMIKEIFEFENSLKILLELNNKYQFEEDNIFTPPPISKIIYEEYSNQFHSLKQVEFIENQITSIEKVDRAFIVSLFDFFSRELKIKRPSGKIFGKIINDYFSFNFGKIKLNGSEGDSHFTKIDSLKKEWESFTN